MPLQIVPTGCAPISIEHAQTILQPASGEGFEACYPNWIGMYKIKSIFGPNSAQWLCPQRPAKRRFFLVISSRSRSGECHGKRTAMRGVSRVGGHSCCTARIQSAASWEEWRSFLDVESKHSHSTGELRKAGGKEREFWALNRKAVCI